MRFREARADTIQLYDLLVPLIAVAAAPVFVARALGRPGAFAHAGERLGRLPPDLLERLRDLPQRPIWMQAASVGEMMLARRLAHALAQAAAPGRMRPVVVSTNTTAGRGLAAGAADLAGCFYLPIDWTPLMRRTLQGVAPAAYVGVETEIWPGLLAQCLRRRVPAVVVNGRISPRSLRGYTRWRALLREPLRAIRLACMQTDADAGRAEAIGFPAASLVVTGNLKFDAESAAGSEEPLRALLGEVDGPLLVAGSTSEGEEEVLLDALDAGDLAGVAGLRMILAPRHPDRFEPVARLLSRRGIPFVRRTGPSLQGWKVLLLDTVGELAAAYRLATVAFVGGSLVPRGGQNLIEPAAAGVPVLFGPRTDTVASVAEALTKAGAGFRVRGAAEIAATLRRLLCDAPARRSSGQAGLALVAANRGATRRTVERMLPLLALDG